MRRILVPFVIMLGFGAAAICGASPVPRPSPQTSLADKWSGELAARTDQSNAVKDAGAKILAEAQPLFEEQQKVEADEKPLLDEKLRVENALAEFKAGRPAYEAQCTSHKFTLPAE